MTIKKKVIMSFAMSFSLMIVLGVLAYVDFAEIIKEVRYLEATDRIRGKTLEVRRYEKNFLYGDSDSADKVISYLGQLRDLIYSEDVSNSSNVLIRKMDNTLTDYRQVFDEIVKRSSEFKNAINELKKGDSTYSFIMPLVSASFLEHPLEGSEALRQSLYMSNDTPLITLQSIRSDVNTLRTLGEELVMTSRDLDRKARTRIERLIRFTQISAVVLIPISFVIGFTLLVLVSHKVVKKLNDLEDVMDKIGHGYFASLPVSEVIDEVDKLKLACNRMSDDLKQREEQLITKDEQLQRGKQLIAIGTLASGIAHELNNPLNNIHLAAQTLTRVMSKGTYPDILNESVTDIYTQTMRVKKIVGDLLEFARSKKPQYEHLELHDVISEVYRRLYATTDLRDIEFVIEGQGFILACRHCIEQVFINLFTNAVDAMSAKGTLRVVISVSASEATITVSDTGEGIPPEAVDRVFEPFFTKKEKGTGLGLFLVYNLIRKQNGHIRVESEAGKGSTFVITLPVIETQPVTETQEETL
ncbi:MAG: hypothetical protein HQL03_12220 [Nitrospirae bacterium]|nr:hypothetical protein [Nitrospirota bacterium]